MKQHISSLSRNIGELFSYENLVSFSPLRKRQEKARRRGAATVEYFRQLCKRRVKIDIALKENPKRIYSSMFLSFGKVGDTYGLMIDTLLPKEGDYRMNPGKEILISYSINGKCYRFESKVKRELKVSYSAYFIDLPKRVERNDKRELLRLNPPHSDFIQIRTDSKALSARFLNVCKITDFHKDGFAMLVPPVTEVIQNNRVLNSALNGFYLQLPDQGRTGLIRGSIRYFRPHRKSNGYICGVFFDQISEYDRIKIENIYYDLQRKDKHTA